MNEEGWGCLCDYKNTWNYPGNFPFKELEGFCIYFSVGYVFYLQEMRRNRYSSHNPFKWKGKDTEKQMSLRTSPHCPASQGVDLCSSPVDTWERLESDCHDHFRSQKVLSRTSIHRCAGGWRVSLFSKCLPIVVLLKGSSMYAGWFQVVDGRTFLY